MKRIGSMSSITSETGDEDATELFRSFVPADRDLASTRAILVALEGHGLTRDDVRLADVVALLVSKDEITCAEFSKMMRDNNLIERALGTRSLAIPDFRTFCLEVEEIRRATEANTSGAPADYIPQLARVDPDQYGVGICSVDGQRYSCGDSCTPFCVQSTTKPLAYAMALEQFGEEVVHQHVGREPSGRNFNERVLNQESRPHNPMINAGAIMTSSLVRPDLCLADRWDFVMDTWTRLAGGKRPGFANSVYLSESATADRNWCLGYMMQEANAFPENTDLKEVLEFYFMLCSIEVDAEMMSVIAATLANGGVCPLTGDRVFNARTVRNTLSLMSSCGMYDYSGEFAFQMGFPCKSGVGGSLVIVIPGVTGICTWSPSLDRLGNSVRGQDFCRALVERYAVHHLDVRSSSLGLSPTGSAGPQGKKELGRHKRTDDSTGVHDCVGLWYAAAEGELVRLKQLISRGVDVDVADYDGRSALHLAAANGHTDCTNFLVAAGADIACLDRFGATPLNEAEREGHVDCIAALSDVKSRSVPSPSPSPTREAEDTPLAEDAATLRNIFRHIDCSGIGCATTSNLISALATCGLSSSDERLSQLIDALRPMEEFDQERFVAIGLAQGPESVLLLQQALTGQLAVPDFSAFKSSIEDIFKKLGDSECTGQVPVKAYSSWRQSLCDEKAFGLGCCTVSGQRCAFGASKQAIPLAELTAALNYCLAQDLRGVATVHSHTGHEPSGRGTEDMALNDDDKPHNPLVNTGAIVSCALIDPNRPTDERFDRMQSTYREAAGGNNVGYCNQHFARERRDSDRSYCLAYMLREKGCFPCDDTTSSGLPVQETLDLFFMANSIEMDAESLAVVAGSLANDGVCPTTNKRVFSALAVRNCLSMMSSCGLGDFSGEFAFHVGLPGKSSRSGFTLLVVPGVMGICVWSPQLDKVGNSVRGVRFAQELVSRFNFHAFEHGAGLCDPTVHPTAEHGVRVSALLTAASTGDLTQIRRLKAEGLDLTEGDYDARTALHLAAAEGQKKVVKFLLQARCSSGEGLLLQKDRWGNTPLDDARRNKHEEVVLLLSRAAQTRVPRCDVLSRVPEHEEVHSTQSIGSCDGETDNSSDSGSSGPLSETSSPTKQTAAAIDLAIVGGSPRIVAQPKAASGLPATPGKPDAASMREDVAFSA
jgi:glutaminase